MSAARSVLLVDCTGKAYHAGNHDGLALGGIERCVTQLSQALARKGMDVAVWNNVPEEIAAGGVQWIPRVKGKPLKSYDIVIACNDARLFDDYAKASGHRDFLPILWFHNRVLFEKTVRKRRMIPMLRWRPVGVFLSGDHATRTTRFLPLRKRVIIGHGLEREILENIPQPVQSRPPVAVFISQPYRGLAGMIRLWMQAIHPALPDARLRIFSANPTQEEIAHFSPDTLAKAGISLESRLPRGALIRAMESARACLIPGHVDETFCLAAAESLALRVPVITYGTGALKERVTDGKNGIIARNETDFAHAMKRILSDDAFWHALHRHGLTDAAAQTWDRSAGEWTALFGDAHE